MQGNVFGGQEPVLGGRQDVRADRDALTAGRDLSVHYHAAAAPVAMAQLPPLSAGFTGRDAELAVVAGLLEPVGGAGVAAAVAGLAGVGKTALAIHAGHAARAKGWFPGGVLFIDLHGYDDAPVQAGQALEALLRALGMPGEHIPESAEERAGLYRSALAQVAEPVLVIADNASSEAQARPLLPGPGPHRVIVTSRHILGGLGARLLDITVLDQAAAVTLLDTLVRAARPGDDRISGDPAAATQLAKACGGLPLALQVSAALLAADPVLTAEELAEELADEASRLGALRYDDGGGAGAPSVTAAFELSYRQLDEDAARLFRLLPVSPGPDVSTGAAAELAGWPASRARAVLGRLARAHLAEPAGSPGRWRMHDLLRLYARQLRGRRGERDQAAGRLLAWYLRQAHAASQHLRARAGMFTPSEFTDRDDALAWLDAERHCLVAAVTMAAAAGRTQEAVRLPIYLGEYLLRRRWFDDLLSVMEVSRDSARQLNDTAREASALNNLGTALRQVRRFEEAITAHQDAGTIFRETGDRHREGGALNNLGVALIEVRRFDEAISAEQDAAAIFREIGDRHHEAMALNNLGTALRQVGRFEEAITAHQDAAAICVETGDRHGESMALNNLGTALRQVGRFEEAITAHQDSRTIYRETGDRHSEGMALGNLGVALVEVRRFDEAVTSHRDTAAIFRETGDRHSEGIALDDLGNALREMGRFDEAVTSHRDAAAIFRETGDRHSEGIAMNNLERDRAAQAPESTAQ